METKICTKCCKEKDIIEFNWKRKSLGQRHARCQECTRQETICHYQQNKTVYKTRARIANKSKGRENAQKIYEYLLKHPCIDCGETDPIVLQFDHVKGIKEYTVANMAYSSYCWETIQKEIDKCEIRCANCHTRKTAKQQGWIFKQ